MGYLTPGEIFEIMIQLKSFGSYFEEILNRKWLLSSRNNDNSYREAWRFGGHDPRGNFEMIDAI